MAPMDTQKFFATFKEVLARTFFQYWIVLIAR